VTFFGFRQRCDGMIRSVMNGSETRSSAMTSQCCDVMNHSVMNSTETNSRAVTGGRCSCFHLNPPRPASDTLTLVSAVITGLVMKRVGNDDGPGEGGLAHLVRRLGTCNCYNNNNNNKKNNNNTNNEKNDLS
jgi:hypothetical protein